MGVVTETTSWSSASQHAPSRSLNKTASKRRLSLKKPWRSLSLLARESEYVPSVAGAVLFGELALCILVIRYIRFTNIDWVAYMEQIELVNKGERDYREIHGDTGPLVYPAGHVWVFSALRHMTDFGKDVRTAQYIFAGIYLATLAIVFRLYSYDRKIPPFAYVLLSLSKRLHSIYILRCFNDGVGMIFLYASVWAICNRRWQGGSVLFSLALGIKMSILLFAPALAFLATVTGGITGAVYCAATVIGIQLAIGQPFLIHNWRAYASRAFEIGRVFKYEWTVNWRFVPEDIFRDGRFSGLLLAGHAITLVWLATAWCRRFGGVKLVFRRLYDRPDMPLVPKGQPLSPGFIVAVFFSSNLVGMLFARSLHYQFYAWEAHSLVFLIWQTRLPVYLRLVLLAGIELGWETFPSTSLSSASLVGCHAVLLGLIIRHVQWKRI